MSNRVTIDGEEWVVLGGNRQERILAKVYADALRIFIQQIGPRDEWRPPTVAGSKADEFFQFSASETQALARMLAPKHLPDACEPDCESPRCPAKKTPCPYCFHSSCNCGEDG